MSLNDDNIDWHAPRTPCATEGCNYPNYHVCLVGKEDKFPELLAQLPTRKSRGTGLGLTEAGRLAIGKSTRDRWAIINAGNDERNKRIVQGYADGASMRQLRELYGIGHGTLVKILHDARDRGEIEIRSRFYAYGKLVG